MKTDSRTPPHLGFTVGLIQMAIHRDTRENLLQAAEKNGSPHMAVLLSMPNPIFFRGQRLPARYANFYIANAAVLVTTFNNAKDRVALGVLAELFPDRPVVGIHAVDLVWGLGTIHSLTQQQPVR